jgi:hypothetical protein
MQTLLTATAVASFALATAGPIPAAAVAARLARNAAVNLTPAAPAQRLATALRHLRQHNLPRHNQTPGQLPLLTSGVANATPLTGALTTALTTSTVGHGLIELPAGTRLLALALDTAPERLVARASLPGTNQHLKVYLSAAAADQARDPRSGLSLLDQVELRLRLLQDARATA